MKIVIQREMIAEGALVLVNADYPLKRREGKRVAVREDSPEILMCETAALRLGELLERIGAGDRIVPVSGWRTREEQEEIYAQSLLENGEAFTKSYVALPDHSEHQTGLAIDLGIKKETIDFIRPESLYTGICGEFRGMAVDYGFIERYGKDKEKITGIAPCCFAARMGAGQKFIMFRRSVRRRCLHCRTTVITGFPATTWMVLS